jgi:chromate transporter
MSEAAEPRAAREAPSPISLRRATRVWAYVGVNSFGGPAGQIAVMHRELVDGRRWLSEQRFLHALNYCVLLPGPEAQQLATYIGWLMHGVPGGVVAGVLFVFPGFLAMLGLSIAYVLWGTVTWVAGALFGIQAAVVAIVVQAVLRIGRRTLRSTALRVVAGAAFLALFLFAVPFPAVIAVAALVGWLAGRRWPGSFSVGRADDTVDPAERPATLLPDDEHLGPGATGRALRAAAVCAVLWLVPVLVLVAVLGSANVFTQEAVLFSKSAVITFGGAYAVLGYIAQQAVAHYQWVTPSQMVVGLGLAETTPGPLIMVVEFVGFLAAYGQPGPLPPLLAGTLGAALTVWVTFLPCFLFIFLGAPYVERLRGNQSLGHALSAVSAAVAGVVLDLAVFFALHTAFGTVDDRTYGPLRVPVPDWSTVRPASLLISGLALVAVFPLRWGTLRVLLGAAVLGVLLAVTGVVSVG